MTADAHRPVQETIKRIWYSVARFRLLERQALLAISVVLLVVSPSGAAVHRLLEQLVATIPVGDDPSEISSEESEEQNQVGMAAFSQSGAIVIYDVLNNNFKIVRNDSLRVVGGPPPDVLLHRRTADIAVTSSALFVLLDGEGRVPRFHVFRYVEPGPWEPIPLFESHEFGTRPAPRNPAVRVATGGDVRLYVDHKDELYLYDVPERRSYPIAMDRAETAPAEQLANAFVGFRGVDGRMRVDEAGSPILFGVQPAGSDTLRSGRVLGVDANGLVYLKRLRDDGAALLQVYQAGQLVAEGLRPRRANAKAFRGDGPMIVGPNGGLYEFQISETALTVSVWRSE